jgi:hypothetical protein
VVGKSAANVDAVFTLEVESLGGGGTNRTKQGGRVELRNGHEVVATQVAIRVARMAGWRATLKVDTADGNYVDRRDGSRS